MKKIVRTGIILSLLVILSNCSESWLDTTPQGAFYEESFYSDDDQVMLGLSAAYAYLRVQFLNDENIGQQYCSYMLMANIRSDDSNVGGQSLSDRSVLNEIGHFTLNSSNVPVYYRWYCCYNGINRSNLVLNNPTYTSEKLPLMQAEAKFLRAFYYFQLLQFYGPVPLVTKSLGKDDYNIKRATYSEVFKQIEQDLTEAIQILPLKSYRKPVERNRATKGAAQALLGKVYLTMASPYFKQGTDYYQKAADMLEMVIESKEYGLEPSYSDIWDIAHEHGLESIFEFDYSAASSTDGWQNGLFASGSIDIQMQGPRLIGNSSTLYSGWGFNIPTHNLINAFNAANDTVRRNATLLTEEEIIKSGARIGQHPPTYAGAYDRKHATWRSIPVVASNSWFDTNERIIRFADVLLMAAEALNKKNSPNDAKALEYLNSVRLRAKLEPLDVSAVALFDSIKNERRLELAMEGVRFFDLVRWDIAAETINKFRVEDNLTEYIREFVKGTHEILPIPKIEIVNSNGLITPNYGYN